MRKRHGMWALDPVCPAPVEDFDGEAAVQPGRDRPARTGCLPTYPAPTVWFGDEVVELLLSLSGDRFASHLRPWTFSRCRECTAMPATKDAQVSLCRRMNAALHTKRPGALPRSHATLARTSRITVQHRLHGPSGSPRACHTGVCPHRVQGPERSTVPPLA
jgi:hypothetical protein